MLIRSQLKQIPVFSGKILDARCGGVGTMLYSSLGVKAYRDFSCRFLWYKNDFKLAQWNGYVGIHVSGKTTFSAILN
jgi:hypothetical protein